MQVNGAKGAADIWENLFEAHGNFEERLDAMPPHSPWANVSRPWGEDVDLVLLDATGNDFLARVRHTGPPTIRLI